MMERFAASVGFLAFITEFSFMTNRDWDAQATLLQVLPRETEGQLQFREIMSGTLRSCLNHAATMTPEGRRKLSIELGSGGRIETNEIADYFGDDRVPPVDTRPTDLL